MFRNSVFPFAAIIGQEKLKRALILSIINPKIGGVLICGEKGTAKSTSVRGLSRVLKDIKVVDLPLNVTEDRLVGGINIESAISKGKKELEEGILRKANGNILYVDEVNLLSEHIVNCILETNGINVIEREGLSIKEECKFILVGTMNPEEGALRSEFLDRFGLYVEVKGCKKLPQRVEIIKRRLEYEKNPYKYESLWEYEENILRDEIIKAKAIVNSIKVKEQALNFAAQLAKASNCDGHRGEIILIETAKAIAALDGRYYINSQDLKEASLFVLPHRMKDAKNGQSNEKKDEMKSDSSKDDSSSSNEKDNKQNNEGRGSKEEKNHDGKGSEKANNNEKNDIDNSKIQEEIKENQDRSQKKKDENREDKKNGELKEEIADIGKIFKVKKISVKVKDRKKRSGSGKRIKTKTSVSEGRYVRYKECNNKVKDLAFDATVRAAAPYQKFRNCEGSLAIDIRKSDIKEKVREKRTGATILFVVDASSSMGANKRMKEVKGAIMSLLTDAYEKRDKVGMIAFRKDRAEVLLNATRSVEMAKKQLEVMPTGGKTPIGFGLQKAYEVFKTCEKRDKEIVPVMVLVSDGRVNYHGDSKEPFKETLNIAHKIREKNIQSIVIDCERGFVKLEMAKEISKALKADYYKIEDLKAEEIANTVRKGI
ncbi:magnesium chelatase subunit D family protein [Haloimpatiens sp. FM7315]|uniref:magnesium chelatase subunit D family protein n=1 Tax=Haloimpatiens sp. FM7315 TaxID=3298609 RepID=UPI00370B22B1